MAHKKEKKKGKNRAQFLIGKNGANVLRQTTSHPRCLSRNFPVSMYLFSTEEAIAMFLHLYHTTCLKTCYFITIFNNLELL